MRISSVSGRLALALSAVFALAAAEAQAAVFFITYNGVDTRPCSRTLPCRQLQRAVNVASDGDEIQILESGEYSGTVNINKSVTISADGISATLTHTAANGLGVRINTAGKVVTLRGLLLSGRGSGLRGITIQQAAAVHIENCDVERFRGDGIFVSNSPAEVYISDTASRLNGKSGLYFVTNVAAKLTIENSYFDNNGTFGAQIQGNLETSVSNSSFSGNNNHGLWQANGRSNVTWSTAASNGGQGFRLNSSAQMTLEESMAAGNTIGLLVNAGTTARLSNSVFTNNNVGVQNSGTTQSRGNNTLSGNTTADRTGPAFSPLGGT
jgi:hypothetical protein